jgi:hypothetical protein
MTTYTMKITIKQSYYMVAGLFLIIIVLIWMWMWSIRPKQNIIIIDNPSSVSSWVELIKAETWKVEIPEDPIGFLYYQKDNWVQWKDIFEIYLENQYPMDWKTVDENNKIMWNYLNDFKYSVNVGDLHNWAYIMFTTEYPIASNRDLFLWLNWASKWAISIEDNYLLKWYYDNEYLFDLDNFWAGWYKINFNNYLSDGKLIIGWYVWQKWNILKKITIVKKYIDNK